MSCPEVSNEAETQFFSETVANIPKHQKKAIFMAGLPGSGKSGTQNVLINILLRMRSL